MKNKIKIVYILALCLVSNLFVPKVYSVPIYVDARASIVMDKNSKIVLFEKNSDMIIPMASTTKIMTALVCLEYGDLDKKIVISKNASNIRGSKVGYKAGEEISIKELLFGLMMKSGNDAAIALAEGTSGSVEEFCTLMNEYARRIGALNTNFESPHGLDSQNHYTTAYDLALITCIAKNNQMFNEIVRAKDANAGQYNFTRSYHNINKILYTIPNASGVKTGYTGNAGKCLVTSVEQENKNELIIVMLNCYNRWNETKKLNDYIKSNYCYEKVLTKDKSMEFIKRDDKVVGELYVDKDIVLPVKKDGKYSFYIDVPNINSMQEELTQDYCGKVTIWSEDGEIYSHPLKYRGEPLKKNKGILDLIKRNKS